MLAVRVLLCCLLYTCLAGCGYGRREEWLDNRPFHRIFDSFPALKGHGLKIYYFDGDCAFCIAKALEIEHSATKAPGTSAVFVARTGTPDILTYNFRNTGITSPLIIDRDSLFAHYFQLNEITNIDKAGRILSREAVQ
ncbi:MAG: hypothetical protein J0H74_16855 [Chitinophagaceae bacterium]|nr:hypothetical protein [Chitinophagaceae bacterium]